MREELNAKTLAVLREMGKAHGLKNVTIMRKSQLIDALIPLLEEEKKEDTAAQNAAPVASYYDESQITKREAPAPKEDASQENAPQENTSSTPARPQGRFREGNRTEIRFYENRLQENRSDNRFPESRYDGRFQNNRSEGKYQSDRSEGRFQNGRSQDSRFNSRYQDGRSEGRYQDNRPDGRMQDGHLESRYQDSSMQDNRSEGRFQDSTMQDNRPEGSPQDGRTESRYLDNRNQDGRSENRYQDRRPQDRSYNNIRTIRRSPAAAPIVSSNPRTGELQDAQGQPRTNYFRAPQRTEARQDNFNPANYADIDSGEAAHGILEIMQDGYGFIRSANFLPGEDDVYVSASQIRRFNMKTGDFISGSKRVRTPGDKNAALLYVNQINDCPPSEAETRKAFEDLTPIFPNERLRLETPDGSLATRVMDLISPIGKGQRGMIVSPPKAGKTTLLKDVAKALTTNHPEVHLIVLLIDERPEEVTDIKECIEGPNTEVIHSTFDELPDNHRRVSEMVLERAKRLVEHKRDVVILLDSITRLARAYNLTCTPSGRTLSGGLDPNALHMPKRFFGAARNMREGGSLTILATALVDTGSRMDDVVFEEFKGTGNMELVLDRKLSEKRIFPALDLQKSGTRRDDLLLSAAEQMAVSCIHKSIQSQKAEESVERILDKFNNTKCNNDLVEAVCRSKYI